MSGGRCLIYRPGVDGISFTVHPWAPESCSIRKQRLRLSRRRPPPLDCLTGPPWSRDSEVRRRARPGPAGLAAPPIEIRLATFSCGSDRVPFISAVARVPFDRHGKTGKYCKPRRGAPCAQAGRPAGCRAGMPNCSYGHAPSAASACNWPGPRGYTGTAWSLLSCQPAGTPCSPSRAGHDRVLPRRPPPARGLHLLRRPSAASGTPPFDPVF